MENIEKIAIYINGERYIFIPCMCIAILKHYIELSKN